MIWRCDLVPQYVRFKDELDEAIQRVLCSGRYILASEVAQFEREFAKYIGVRHAVGVASGTDALILTMVALGIGPGDEVVTTPFTAIPTVSAIIAVGAYPKFVDIHPDTFLMDIGKVKNAVNERTKAVMPVHLFGNIVDIELLRSEIGDGIPIIEDACQAHGSSIDGHKAGSIGDIGAFSFYPTKNLGGYGDGGAVTTNREDFAQRIKLLRMYGMTDHNHIEINGVNSRIDELQAAILRVKLKYLDEMNRNRSYLAKRYADGLDKSTFAPQFVEGKVTSNYHVYSVIYRGDRDALMSRLERRKIQTNVYYSMPIYAQKANTFLKVEPGACPVAEYVCKHILALPMYSELPMDIQDEVIKAANKGEDAEND
jgi:dTDP-4-amino-4,6-dideoxygalactose transaminase